MPAHANILVTPSGYRGLASRPTQSCDANGSAPLPSHGLAHRRKRGQEPVRHPATVVLLRLIQRHAQNPVIDKRIHHRAEAAPRTAQPPSAARASLTPPSTVREFHVDGGDPNRHPVEPGSDPAGGRAARQVGSLPVQRDASMGPGCPVPSNRSRRVFQHIADHIGANASDGRGDIDPLLVGHPRSAVLVRWLTQ
jgi:hypothetical protein